MKRWERWKRNADNTTTSNSLLKLYKSDHVSYRVIVLMVLALHALGQLWQKISQGSLSVRLAHRVTSALIHQLTWSLATSTLPLL